MSKVFAYAGRGIAAVQVEGKQEIVLTQVSFIDFHRANSAEEAVGIGYLIQRKEGLSDLEVDVWELSREHLEDMAKEARSQAQIDADEEAKKQGKD